MDLGADHITGDYGKFKQMDLVEFKMRGKVAQPFPQNGHICVVVIRPEDGRLLPLWVKEEDVTAL